MGAESGAEAESCACTRAIRCMARLGTGETVNAQGRVTRWFRPMGAARELTTDVAADVNSLTYVLLCQPEGLDRRRKARSCEHAAFLLEWVPPS